MAKIERIIEGYEKNGDKLILEIPLRNVPLSFLQQLFRQPISNPMFDCFPISAKEVKALENLIAKPLDLQSLDYFLTAQHEKT